MDVAFLSESNRREIEDEVSPDIILQEKMDEAFLFERSRGKIEDEVSSHIISQDKITDALLCDMEKMDGAFLSESIRRKFEDEETMDDLFSRKTDWVLVEEESLATTAFSFESCWLCEEKISLPYYTSEEGGETETIFMHQVCVELPMEMEHKLHRGHTLRSLRRTGGSYQVCSSCNELGHVYYNCSDCEDFVLDIRVHYGISYQCLKCPSFQVHQDCAERVKLPAHRHYLELLYSLPDNHYGEPIYCQICREDMKDQKRAYHCARCRYFFHIYDCRSIKHFSQPHPLVLVEEEGADAESASANCGGCGMKISVPYYVQIVVNPRFFQLESVFLHKFCAELPQSMEHHLHPGHDLTLGKSKEMCDACHAPSEGFSYCCPHVSCHFSIDIICALKNIHLQNKFHEHPLISSHTKAPLACRACNKDSEGPSYQCMTCRFWVHQQCASLPTSRKHGAHPHMLKINYSLHENGEKFRCHVCREDIQLHNWAYQCAGCKYYTHVHDCSNPPWSREIVDFDYKAALAAAVHLPAVDDKYVSSLATMFFMETNREVDAKDIKTSHALFLDPNETCDRCEKFLAAPCNHCALCKYFLPKSHAELVDDPVSLLDGYNSMLKETKENNCNGFGISFLRSRLIITISSSVLPRYVKHEGHRHVLSTTFLTKPTWYSACEENIQGYAFRCNICAFTIDTYCALLPGSIRHRYDKKHSFKLTFYSIEDVQEYVCEICEEDITKMWFFHCAECDHSIHARCIWKLHIMFGPFINYDGSPSYDKFTLVPTAKTQHQLHCSECKQNETLGCRYSLFWYSNMTHLQCKPDIKMERWPRERKNSSVYLLF